MPSYYETHKDQLKAKMRENDAKRRAKIREDMKNDPAVAEREREKMRMKYYKQNEGKVKRALDDCLASASISPVFQKYIRDVLFVNDNFKHLTMKSVILLKSLSTIHNAETSKGEIDFSTLFDEGYSAEGSEGTEESEGENTQRSASF